MYVCTWIFHDISLFALFLCISDTICTHVATYYVMCTLPSASAPFPSSRFASRSRSYTPSLWLGVVSVLSFEAWINASHDPHLFIYTSLVLVTFEALDWKKFGLNSARCIFWYILFLLFVPAVFLMPFEVRVPSPKLVDLFFPVWLFQFIKPPLWNLFLSFSLSVFLFFLLENSSEINGFRLIQFFFIQVALW